MTASHAAAGERCHGGHNVRRFMVGPEDIVALCASYAPSLLICLVGCLASWVLLARRPSSRFSAPIKPYLIAAPAIAWLAYTAMTIRWRATLTFLDSEDAALAEITYRKAFQPAATVEQAIGLAVDGHLAPNVRFYAASLIAEKSSKLGDSELEDLLKRTDNAPVIQTQFIGGNSLTAEFYFPGRSQPRISIREIVQRRLQHLRSNQQP